MFNSRFLNIVLFVAIVAICVFMMFGCQAHKPAPPPPPPHILHWFGTPGSPTSHPFQAGTEAVQAVRNPLMFISVVSGFAFMAFVGLLFTPLSFVSKLGLPIAGAVAALSFAGVIVLPFFPWVISGLVLSAIGFLLYEICRTHSLLGALKAIRVDILPALPSTGV